MRNNFSRALFLSGATLLSSGIVQAKSTLHVDNISARCRAIMNDKNALCVDKQSDGKYYVTHFQTGKAVKQFLASPGKPHKDGGTYTPEWTFPIDRKARKQPTYYGWHLPYASHIGTKIGKDGVYFHVGKTNGNLASHGCVRLPDAWAKYIFNTIPMNTKVAIDNTRPKR